MQAGIVINYYAYRGKLQVYQKKQNLEHLTFYPKFFKKLHQKRMFQKKIEILEALGNKGKQLVQESSLLETTT